MIIKFIREKYIYIAAGSLAVLNIVLLQFPLLNVLGFESSIVNTVAITIFSGIAVMGKLKRRDIQLGNLAKPVFSLLEEFALFLIIPVSVFILHMLFFETCPVGSGVWFYFLFVLPAFMIGGALGSLSYLIYKRYPGVIFTVLFIGLLIPSAVEMYAYPQTYFYNPVVPFFPGSVFEEAIEITPLLIYSRLYYFIFFGIVFSGSLAVVYFGWKRIYQSLVPVVSIILYAILCYNSPEEGFSTSVETMKNELDGRAETEHFVIYFPSSIEKKELESIIMHHEYYYSELAKYLHTKPSRKITSFMFINTAQKQRLLGPANADVAKPWLYQTYTNYDNYKITLKHEIAHCFSAEFGYTMFKMPYWFNPSLAEGLAMAAENEYNEATVHDMAALAYVNNYKSPLKELFTGLNFFAHNSSFSYIYAGSFVKYLIDTYGVDKFKQLYSTADYTDIYGKDISALSRDYYKFLSEYPADSSKAKSIYYFGRLALINRKCPRYTALRLAKTWELYTSGRYNRAEKEFKDLYEGTQTYSALMGRVNSLIKLEKYDTAWKYLETNVAKFDSTPYAFNINLQLADLRAINGNYAGAKDIYYNLSNNSPTNVFLYISNLRLQLVKDTALIKRYLQTSDIEKLNILKSLNKNGYVYSSIPPMIDLSSSLKEDYSGFMQSFAKSFAVTDFLSSYAAFKLSGYALENLDYANAEKFAAVAIQLKGNQDFLKIAEENLSKVLWLKKHSNHSSKSFILNF